MATTTNFSFELPTVAGDDGTWGGKLNDNWTDLDTLLGNIGSGVVALGSPDINGGTIDGATIDGRNVGTDGTKLDTIETSADVTDTANVTAAGALMDSELTNIAAVKALNQGVATSNSPAFAALTVNGNLDIPAAIRHIGDTDTYTEFNAANTWRIVTGGTERMRVNATAVTIGGTDSNPAVSGENGIALRSDNAISAAALNGICAAFGRNGGTNGSAVSFFRSGSAVGNISLTTTATAYNTSSDYRMKEDVQPISDAATRVLSLAPRNFRWKADQSRSDGFIAHEVQQIVPDAVSGAKDAVDEDGNPAMQGVDYSKLVPLLTAALQDALTRIKALEEV